MKVINRINNINMKSILNLLLFAGLLIFSACDKDLVDNPTYKKPNTFALQTPEFAKTTVDLKEVKDCLLYTSDAADELDGVDLGGRRIIKKKKKI